MKYKKLAKGVRVSELCFGSLTMTPFQGNLSIEEGASLIEYAYSKGINFIDTAQLYENYHYIGPALTRIGRENMVVSTKTYAYSRETAQEALHEALIELDTDYIDVFLLHEQESKHTIRGHYEALEYFLEQKEKGKIKALGISTHRVEGARAFNAFPELDILHPLVNYKGLGLTDGNLEEMVAEIDKALARGKGVYAMKILGGGHLIGQIEEAISFVRGLNVPMAIGLQSEEEIDVNIALVEDRAYPSEHTSLKTKSRKLLVDQYCDGCANCVSMCQNKGMELIDGRAVVTENCMLCGYCAHYCPGFYIKVV